MVKGSASPHTYALAPSDAAAMQASDVIFWIGPEMEAFLEKPLQALGGKALITQLDQSKGLIKLPPRAGGAFDKDADAAEGAPGDLAVDEHLWLDPENAKSMVNQIERTLVEKDPANAVTYKANADKTNAELDVLEAELTVTLAPIKGKPFISFHDAFQYFEKRFGLQAAGSITVNPDSSPGAARVAELQAKVQSSGAACVFAEPNFAPDIVSTAIEGSKARVGTLDPEAADLTEGPELYFQSLRGIAAAMAQCLGG
jgi:zinc transport system substrate-binding protein